MPTSTTWNLSGCRGDSDLVDQEEERTAGMEAWEVRLLLGNGRAASADNERGLWGEWPTVAASLIAGDAELVLNSHLTQSNEQSGNPDERWLIGVAAIQLFAQANWTGPWSNSQHRPWTQLLQNVYIDALHRLALDGEELRPVVRHPHLLILARDALQGPEAYEDRNSTTTDNSYLPQSERLQVATPQEWYQIADASDCRIFSKAWWLWRLNRLHESSLTGPSITLRRQSFRCFELVLGKGCLKNHVVQMQLKEESSREPFSGTDLHPSNEPDKYSRLRSLLQDNPTLHALALLELAQAQISSFEAKAAWWTINSASEVLNVGSVLSGLLGVRTKFQHEAKSQLSVAVTMITKNIIDLGDSRQYDGSTLVTMETDVPRNVELIDTDFLGKLKLNEPELHPLEVSDLPVIVQLLLLAHCDVVEHSSVRDAAADEEMSALSSRVIEFCSTTNPIVLARALLTRTRLESMKTRYLERNMQQMEALCDFVEMSEVKDSGRWRFVARLLTLFASSFPPRWDLKKEFAVTLGKIGLVKSALDLFQESEFWEEAIDCLRLMGNNLRAKDLIEMQIEAKGRTPTLLSLLGDVTSSEGFYEEAWAASGHRFARAKRSLGRAALGRQCYNEAVEHYLEALHINPLYVDAWFALGFAAQMCENWDISGQAFSKVIQITPDNGEAWNNLGHTWVELGRLKEALNALSEAARLRRNNWKIWDNLVQVATEVKSVSHIINGVDALLDCKGRGYSYAKPVRVAVGEIVNASISEDAEVRASAGRQSRRLVQVLIKCTSIISSDPEIWSCIASLYCALENWDGELRARQKEIRARVGSASQWWHEEEGFEQMALSSLSLVKACHRAGTAADREGTRLHINSIVTRAEEHLRVHSLHQRLVHAAYELSLTTASQDELKHSEVNKDEPMPVRSARN